MWLTCHFSSALLIPPVELFGAMGPVEWLYAVSQPHARSPGHSLRAAHSTGVAFRASRAAFISAVIEWRRSRAGGTSSSDCGDEWSRSPWGGCAHSLASCDWRASASVPRRTRACCANCGPGRSLLRVHFRTAARCCFGCGGCGFSRTASPGSDGGWPTCQRLSIVAIALRFLFLHFARECGRVRRHKRRVYA
jgi:hypothetical protein